jgi:hypothetical protein
VILETAIREASRIYKRGITKRTFHPPPRCSKSQKNHLFRRKESEATLFVEVPNMTHDSAYGSNSLPRVQEDVILQETPPAEANVGLLGHDNTDLRNSERVHFI